MGFRFYRRVPLVPGLRLNLSKSGPSVSLGHRGLWYTLGKWATALSGLAALCAAVASASAQKVTIDLNKLAQVAYCRGVYMAEH